MAIQVRRGLYINFDPNKLLTGEFAVSTDRKVVHIAFAPGVVKRLATYEDMKSDMQESLQEIINSLTTSIKQATDNANTKANLAEQKAMLADAKAILADQKAQQAQAIIDNAAQIMNKNLQASYENKATGMTGSFITCPTSDDGLVHVTRIEGETQQVVTVQSKNEFDKNKPNILSGLWTDVNTGKIGSTLATSSIYIKCLPNTSYTVSKVASQRFTVAYSYEIPVANTPIYGTQIEKSPTVKQLTTDANAKYLIVYLYKSDVDTLTLTEILASLQIEVGIVNNPTYEPFTPNSPSPEYPSPLIYAKDFNLYTSGNNLFNIDNTYTKANDITSVKIDGDTLTVIGNNTVGYSSVNYEIDINVIKGKTIVLSHDTFTSTNTGISPTIQAQLTTDGVNTYYGSTKSGTVITVPQNASRFYVKFLMNNRSTAPNVESTIVATKVQLEINEKRNYDKYKGIDKKTISFPFISLPNGVKNSIELINGVLTKVERSKEVVLDGRTNETWFLQQSSPLTLRFAYTNSEIKKDVPVSTKNISCDKFKSSTQNELGNDIEGVSSHSSQGMQLRINISRLSTADIAGFKAWLTANPITIQYEMVTPIYTPIDDIYLKSWFGTTHIFTNSTPQVQLTADFKSELWSRDYLQDIALKSKVDTNTEIEFTEASIDVDIATKDTLPTLFGKILKSIKNLRSGLALKFDKSNIVQTDTVSDASKVPSSVVTEVLGKEIDTLNNKLAYTSGSNVNGNYIKFADGTMICRATFIQANRMFDGVDVPNVRYTADTIAYPVEFISVPQVTVDIDIDGHVGFTGRVQPGLKNLYIMACILGATIVTTSYKYHYIAVGKWK